MKSAIQPIGQALQLQDVEQRFRKARPGAFTFLFESCCIVDTQPPLPPGTGG
jgi:hypothetical protein